MVIHYIPFALLTHGLLKLRSHRLWQLVFERPCSTKSLSKRPYSRILCFCVQTSCVHVSLRKFLSFFFGSTYKPGVHWTHANSSNSWTSDCLIDKQLNFDQSNSVEAVRPKSQPFEKLITEGKLLIVVYVWLELGHFLGNRSPLSVKV